MVFLYAIDPVKFHTSCQINTIRIIYFVRFAVTSQLLQKKEGSNNNQATNVMPGPIYALA